MDKNSDSHTDIVIVFYGDPEELDACIASVKRHCIGYTLHIVDNNMANRGYTRGVNEGIENGKAPYIWLLNQDATVLAEAQQALIKRLESDPRIGIAGSMQLSPDDKDFITHGGTLRAFPTGLHRGGRISRGECLSPMQQTWVNFASVMLKREMVDQIGLLDPAMFLFYSDSDYCYRARHYGWQVWYEPDSRVLHKLNVSASGNIWQTKDMLVFMKKWGLKLNSEMLEGVQKEPWMSVEQRTVDYAMVDRLCHARKENVSNTKCKKMPSVSPEMPIRYFEKGNICREENRLDDAIGFYQKAISLKPTYAEAHNNLGLVFQDRGELRKSIKCFKKAVEIDSGLFQAHFNMGVSIKECGEIEEAISSFQKALFIKPDLSSAYGRLGSIYRERNQFEEAVECFRKQTEMDPTDAKAFNNLGSVLHDMGKMNEAMECFNTSLRLRPEHVETRWNLSLVQLLQGDFSEGWRGHECRFERKSHKPTFPEKNGIPRWSGTSFAGKRLLVEEEQGFGDILQFVRYLPLVKELGGTVLFKVRRPLLNLLRNIEGVDEIFSSYSERVHPIDFDYHVPLLSLPLIFNTTIETIPSTVPYIYPDRNKAGMWQKKLPDSRFNIGVVWTGRLTEPSEPAYVRNRSCSLEHFKPLSTLPGLALYGLQKSLPEGQGRNISEELGIRNLGELFNDFSDTSAAIANMDLIISVDTAVAHLAGAMGRPVWLLLQYVADFRWMQDRDDSPWYPTMRLFRQRRPGDWDEVFERVHGELKSLLFAE